MREIIFRGKHTDTGEWVYGDLIHRILWDKSLIIIRTYDYSFDTYKDYDVIPESVGQFTGLCDKNGVKIFEGDIINIDYSETVVEDVVIEYVGTSFYGSSDYDDWELDEYCQLEIIGNIHDNLKLIER